MIRVKRAYDPPEASDGRRFLVDRLWPRGRSKDVLRLDGWVKDASPSDALRRWYGHDPEKWDEFRRRYWAELDSRAESWRPLAEAARAGDITLVFSSREERLNNAVALREYLEDNAKGPRARR